MIPRSFEYFRPQTVTETVKLLGRYRGQAKILAGGMSLVPLLKLRLASPAYLIDINRVSDLEYVRRRGNLLAIGALTRHHAIESSPFVKQRLPLFAETASRIGDPQVRNMGSIGGSLCHSDPSGDWGAAIIASRSEMMIRGGSGERSVTADDFLVDTFVSAVKEDELLTEVRVPLPPPRSGGAYVKLEKKAGDFAVVGVAVQLSLDKNGVCASAGVGLTALGQTNLRAKKAEAAMLGKKVSGGRPTEAASAAAEEAQPLSDVLRGSVEYRRAMTRVCAEKAIKLAISRARRSR